MPFHHRRYGGRRSIRLKGYDYSSQGAYFVTICAHERQCLFEDSVLYDITVATWEGLPERFPSIELDEFILMPNHLHFVIWLQMKTVYYGMWARMMGTWANDGEGAGASPAPTGTTSFNQPTLGDVVGAFKSIIAVEYLNWIKENDPQRSGRVWQRNYYERIIRNDRELEHIRQYIRDNPVRWAQDRDHLDELLSQMQMHQT